MKVFNSLKSVLLTTQNSALKLSVNAILTQCHACINIYCLFWKKNQHSTYGSATCSFTWNSLDTFPYFIFTHNIDRAKGINRYASLIYRHVKPLQNSAEFQGLLIYLMIIINALMRVNSYFTWILCIMTRITEGKVPEGWMQDKRNNKAQKATPHQKKWDRSKSYGMN